MLSGDGRAIKAIPLQMIPAPTPTYFDGRPYGLPEGWIVEQRLRTSLKYFGKIDQFVHEVKTRKRFRSIKAAKNGLRSNSRWAGTGGITSWLHRVPNPLEQVLKGEKQLEASTLQTHLKS
ncbi:unnamed protein product [Prunus armeniaca]|uniref:Uncharacterized protein n=1 Tax=Prunus armeniaca TaxID=36596 RepID=A0A6J5V6B7_PRUAR|nr:unnamed protein product [Prunus armeniaca]